MKFSHCVNNGTVFFKTKLLTKNKLVIVKLRLFFQLEYF